MDLSVIVMKFLRWSGVSWNINCLSQWCPNRNVVKMPQVSDTWPWKSALLSCFTGKLARKSSPKLPWKEGPGLSDRLHSPGRITTPNSFREANIPH